MNTKDFNELAVAIVNSTDDTVPMAAARVAVHRALSLDQLVREAHQVASEQRDLLEAYRAAMVLALGQIQIGNVKGAYELLQAQTQSRGHNARLEGH